MMKNNRKGEQIGAGYFVFRRGKKTNRISTKSTMPFEHPDLKSAIAEANKLAANNPGERFAVVGQVHEAVSQINQEAAE